MKIINLFEIKKYGWLNTASKNEQKDAIERFPTIIDEIEFPSLDLQLLATDLDNNSLFYIKNPSPQLFNKLKDKIILHILRNIKNDYLYKVKLYIKYLDAHNVHWPELDVIKNSLQADKLIESINYNSLSEEEQIKYIRMYGGYVIAYIDNPSEQVQLAAVKKDIGAFRDIKDPSKDVVITAILKLITQQFYVYAIELIKKYEHNNWPELDIIKTSLRADGKIK